jgi:hypothetical protein
MLETRLRLLPSTGALVGELELQQMGQEVGRGGVAEQQNGWLLFRIAIPASASDEPITLYLRSKSGSKPIAQSILWSTLRVRRGDE